MHHLWNPDNYTRNVTEADAWAEGHLDVLRLVFQAFEESGEWPEVEALQRELIRQGSDLDLVAEVAEMPPTIGVAQHSGEVSLSVRGLSHLPESSSLLAGFIAAIELAVERFRGTEEEPKITDADLRGLRMDARMVERVSALIFRESWPFGGGSGLPDGSWERSVTLEIRHLVIVQSVAEYLRIQAELRYGPPPSPGPLTPEVLETSPSPAAPPITLPQSADETSDREPASTPVRPRTTRSIGDRVLLRLIFKILTRLKDEGYFIEAFEEGEWYELRAGGEPLIALPRIEDPEAWLMLTFGVEGLWPDLAEPRRLADQAALATPFIDRGLLLDTLELFHRDVVSRPVTDEEGNFEGSYDRGGGQRELRQALAPVLGRLDPPLEMRSDGEITPRSAVGLEVLSDQPLPSTAAADDVRGKVQDAIRLFRDRTVSAEGQLAALTQLAGVLERLRDDDRLADAMAGRDSGALFDIANNYGIRHDNADQRRDYGPAFREWIFHAYLAAIRLSTRVADEEGPEDQSAS